MLLEKKANDVYYWVELGIIVHMWKKLQLFLPAIDDRSHLSLAFFSRDVCQRRVTFGLLASRYGNF